MARRQCVHVSSSLLLTADTSFPLLPISICENFCCSASSCILERARSGGYVVMFAYGFSLQSLIINEVERSFHILVGLQIFSFAMPCSSQGHDAWILGSCLFVCFFLCSFGPSLYSLDSNPLLVIHVCKYLLSLCGQSFHSIVS